MRTNSLLKVVGGLLVLLVAGFMTITGSRMWHQTYDTTEPINPLRAVKVSEGDLQSASPCAQEVVGALLHQNLAPTRSKLFYTEWECRIAAKKFAIL